MPQYLAPGVYVEEVPSGARPIEAVGTSVAGFVGVAPDPDAPLNKVIAINNWTEFVARFAAKVDSTTDLAKGVYAYFMNGGSRAYVVNVGAGNPISGGKTRTGLDLFEQYDGISTVAACGYSDIGSHTALLAHCDKMRFRFALLDSPEVVDDITRLKKVATDKPAPSGGDGAGKAAVNSSGGLRPPESSSGRGAFYFPWMTMRDPFDSKKVVGLAPSGAVAGIFARVDGTRGVHKAPANEGVAGATSVSYRVTREEQEELNPAGVNVIRFFDDAGVRVWGARTLANSASEWRYVNVRRLFNMIEESIDRGTRSAVFEPNDRPLWQAIKRDVGAFLGRIWRDGALMGRTAEQAFFVQCDESINTQDEIDAGRVNVNVGIAPVKPAEFVVFRVSQGASVEESSAEEDAANES